METSRKSLIQRVKNLDKVDFHKRLDIPKLYNPKTGCNLAWVFYHLAEDEIHHRGQISIIRKLYQHQKGNSKSKKSDTRLYFLGIVFCHQLSHYLRN